MSYHPKPKMKICHSNLSHMTCVCLDIHKQKPPPGIIRWCRAESNWLLKRLFIISVLAHLVSSLTKGQIYQVHLCPSNMPVGMCSAGHWSEHSPPASSFHSNSHQYGSIVPQSLSARLQCSITINIYERTSEPEIKLSLTPSSSNRWLLFTLCPP